MASVKVYKADGSAGSSKKLNDAIFDVEPNMGLVHQVAVALMNNARQGNAETRTRREVRGGGRKPFAQKGTGRARQGSSREPQMRGGGTVFGPHRRSYRKKVPTKMRRKALCCVLTDRLRNDRLCVLEEFSVDAPKTRPVLEMWKNLAPEGRKTLLVAPASDTALLMSSRNLPGLIVRRAADVNALDVLDSMRVIVLDGALGVLEERLT
ncbi:MAG: 50S ribosomal protein L4 [Candidatus Hydrogenedentes bacterium]|nr:50S ribosomal protein L4 [Candidatus Hydrogenedentota bacterium]